MVRYIPDPTGRFAQRPFYTEAELDRECEGNVNTFLLRHRGKVEFPIATEDLKMLVEGEVQDLDQYADLRAYGSDVEGVTIFEPGRKPRVQIASYLADDDWRENRLRTTLTHELWPCALSRVTCSRLTHARRTCSNPAPRSLKW